MFRKNNWILKTTVPETFHELLPRKNIAAIIDNAPLDEAVCIVAPYGCGKTLAVISWLRERGREAAWVTLDETDNSESDFFASLSAAVMRLDGWKGSMDDILANPQYIGNPQVFLSDRILAAEKNNRDKILVIDRLQFIKDPTLLRTIKNLVYYLLRNWRIIIICRAELPPVFNDLMLKRHICLITLKELSFSHEEISEFFFINGCPAPEEDVSQISMETEGWPASLNVILTISRGAPMEYSETVREYIMGFFETEIWEPLGDGIKDFLLKTSVLDKLTPAACNAVTDMGATQPTLRWLFENGLFLFRLGKIGSYRYHRVFSDFLQSKLSASGIDKRELYKKIAWWLFERDEFEHSFPYFFQARDLYGLSQVFRNINSTDMGIDRYLELTNCITTLNVDELHVYPLIISKIALIHYAMGNLYEMQRLYGIITSLIEPGVVPISPEEFAECAWEVGWLSYLNPAEPILNNKKHEEWFNYTEEDARLHFLHHTRAAAYRFPSILRGIRDYCPVLCAIDGLLQHNETSYNALSGEISQSRLYVIKAEYAYELEEFSLAEELIRDVMAEVERQQITDLYFVCVALLVKIMRAVHNPDEISTLASRLEMMIVKNGHAFLLPRFHAFEQRNRLLDGIAGQTEEFERENKDYADKPYFYLSYQQITLVRALLSTGSYNEAIMILGNLEFLCQQYNRIMDLIEVNILRSVADYGLGHKEGACQYLSNAINAAREYGFIRIFSDDAKDLWPILNFIEKDMNDNYFKSIIISCKKTLARAGIKIHKKNLPYSELTKTETKILKTLDTGMSYNEIALDNEIKISTVKSHLHSIYSKLGVDNRTSAVIAAQKLGIID